MTDPINQIRWLADFNGFTFDNDSVTCIYNATLPIRGSINLNGGIFFLNRDLRFDDVISFVGQGKIYGNNGSHTVTFPGNLTSWNYSFTFQDVALIFNADLTLNNASFSFKNTCTIDGSGKQIDLRNGGQIYIEPGAELTLKNVSLLGLENSNVQCLEDDSSLHLKNSSLIVSDNYSFTKGKISVYQDSKISGTGIFDYQSSQNLTIRSKSKLFVDRYVTFKYNPVVASKDLIIMEDATSILHLNGCTFDSTTTSPILTGGRLVVQDRVTVRNDATSPDEALILQDPLEIDVLSGSVFDVVAGLLEYQ